MPTEESRPRAFHWGTKRRCVRMFTPARFLAILALSLGVGLVADAQTGPPPRKINPTVAAVLKLADNLEREDVCLQAKKIVEEMDACAISQVFTLRRPRGGGPGIGSAVKAGHKDSIEDLVRNWSGSRPPTREELQTHRKDLVQVARVLQAMAEVAPFRVNIYVPKENKQKVEAWRKVS